MPEFGLSQGDDQAPLYRVTAAVWVESGDLIVADDGLHELRHYSEDGNFRGVVSQVGEGPGEFIRLTALHPLKSGGFWLFDAGLGRATRFGTEQTLEEVVSFVPKGVPVIAELHRLDGGDSIARSGAVGSDIGGGVGVIRLRSRVQRYDATGAWAEDIGQLMGRSVYRGPAGGSFTLPIASHGELVVDPTARRVMLGDGVDRAVRVISLGSRSEQRVEWSGGPLELDRRAARQLVSITAMTSSDSARVERQIEISGLPLAYPPHGKMLPAPEGRIWVQDYPDQSSAVVTWYVLDIVTRAVVARVFAPSGLHILQVSKDRVLGSRWDQWGGPTWAFIE